MVQSNIILYVEFVFFKKWGGGGKEKEPAISTEKDSLKLPSRAQRITVFIISTINHQKIATFTLCHMTTPSNFDRWPANCETC